MMLTMRLGRMGTRRVREAMEQEVVVIIGQWRGDLVFRSHGRLGDMGPAVMVELVAKVALKDFGSVIVRLMMCGKMDNIFFQENLNKGVSLRKLEQCCV